MRLKSVVKMSLHEKYLSWTKGWYSQEVNNLIACFVIAIQS